MATRYDVAKNAGVSPATVSHVINNTKYVSPESKQRVEEVIRALNYKPNMVARSLVTKLTKHVGILVNDITNPYYGEIAQGMEEVAQKNGYMVSIFFAQGNTEEYFTSIIQRQLDGLFFATARNVFSVNHIKAFHDAGIAMVNSYDRIGSCVEFNYEPAIESVIKYLSDLGHKRIGFLNGLSLREPGSTRYELFRESILKYGLELDMNLFIDGEYPYQTNHHSGYDSMKKLLAGETRVTAVMCTNDLMAFGAVKAIHEVGLRIPEDISVVGCDDIFLTECIDPPLTTLRAKKKDMGRQAMNLLLNEIKEKKSAFVRLNVDLVIRGSTGPAKKL
jgi:DNA-binding LacI/PurR family transcriptional regulator